VFVDCIGVELVLFTDVFVGLGIYVCGTAEGDSIGGSENHCDSETVCNGDCDSETVFDSDAVFGFPKNRLNIDPVFFVAVGVAVGVGVGVGVGVHDGPELVIDGLTGTRVAVPLIP